MPSSADDLDDLDAQGEHFDDAHDPLSFEEYSASAKRRRSRFRSTANHVPTLRTSMTKGYVSDVPPFEKTNQATATPSRSGPQTAAAGQSHGDVTETEEDPMERPRKKPRGVLLEMPIWTQPGLSRSKMPKTSWDRHWSRRHNPQARTFDEHGNKIASWHEVQKRQRREQGMRPHAHHGKGFVKPNSTKNQPTSLAVEGKAEIKLEHTCLSDEVASNCPACAKEEESGWDTLLSDDRIIDPAVARRLLPEHTCFSGSLTGPCVACERENETQRKDEVDVVDQHGRPLNNADDLLDPKDDSDEEPEEYDWEDNPNVPKPQFITRIIKCYSKRKPFTPEEDRLIVQMYEEEHKNWDDIMEAVRRRSRGQLQYRYYTTLRSENWKEKRAAAADAIKQQKFAEEERVKRQKTAESSVRSLSGSIFEKPKKKPMVSSKNTVRIKEEDLEWEEWLRSRRPLDPAFLPPPEDSCQSPDFFPTVPPALGLSSSSYVNSQTSPDPNQDPDWLNNDPVPSQIEGVLMEPATQLSRPYEQLYPEIYPYAQTYKDSKSPTLDHDWEADSSGDETLLECNDRHEEAVSQEATSVGTSHSNSVHLQRDFHVDLHEDVNKEKRHSMGILPPNTEEVNVSAIAISTPVERNTSSLGPPQESFYDTDGSLEEVDLI